ncbi:MAG: GNAT family N-acyltransferase [Acidobacteriota bacterium]|jgi:putative hemolysin
MRSDFFLPCRPIEFADSRYLVKLADSEEEIKGALRLRHRVFNIELAGRGRDALANDLEYDAYDAICRHLIVIEHKTGRVVGTYRVNTIESAVSAEGFYSFSEFSIEDLPAEVLREGVEVGRACIAAEHRNTRVLFLLWKGLAAFLQAYEKRFVFGCCSIFTRDPLIGEKAFHQLARADSFHPVYRVEPRRNALYLGPVEAIENDPVQLPHLFELYLRLGAKVCGPPIIDTEFGTIDFFVVFDRCEIPAKYHKIYFAGLAIS